MDGSFTIDTPATKAVVGFAEGQTAKLGQVTITPQSRFGAVYVTAQGPGEDIAKGKGLLVVAIARARNTGEKVFQDSRIIEPGKPPVVMEPVKATIKIDRPGTPPSTSWTTTASAPTAPCPCRTASSPLTAPATRRPTTW